jgi:hypothetical protein
MLVSYPFHVVFTIFMLSIECGDVYHSRIIYIHVSPHAPYPVIMEIVRSPSPFRELISPYFFIDSACKGILRSVSDHIFILESGSSLKYSNWLHTWRSMESYNCNTNG